MSDSEMLWAIFEFTTPKPSVTVMRANGFAADSEGPTFHSRDEVWRFVSELRDAADRVWPDDEED
jgi:hypothetical protein